MHNNKTAVSAWRNRVGRRQNQKHLIYLDRLVKIHLKNTGVPSWRGSSQPRDPTHISCASCIGKWILYHLGKLGSPPFKEGRFNQRPEIWAGLASEEHTPVFLPGESQGWGIPAWWAAVYGVPQSWTRLKWLSSSSSKETDLYTEKYKTLVYEEQTSGY